MTTRVRQSKYRHIFGKEGQLRECYQDIRLGTCWTESSVIKANSTFFAVPWLPTGTICVVPVGRMGAVPEETPIIALEEAQITEFNFSPFNHHLLLASASDGSVNVFKLPDGNEGLTTNITNPAATLGAGGKAHDKRALDVEFHPLAENVVVSTDAGKQVKLWDLNHPSAEKVTLPDVHKGLLTAFTWSHDGGLLATHCKDKKLRLFDPRAPSVAAEVEDHQGAKSATAVWLGRRDQLLTAGFNKRAERCLALYDARNLGGPKLTEITVDQSPSSFLPIYDDDTSLLFLAGKGDGNIRYYEVNDEAPFLHLLSEYKSKTAQSGLVKLSKLGNNVLECELLRFLKLTPKQVIPLRFEVPRLNKEYFEPEIFPDTWDEKPTVQAEEWFAGEARQPNLVSLDPGSRA